MEGTNSVNGYLYVSMRDAGEMIVLPRLEFPDKDRGLVRSIRRKIEAPSIAPSSDEQEDTGQADRYTGEEPIEEDCEPQNSMSSTVRALGEGQPFEHAVTHRLGRPRPGTLRLWTIQEWAAWEGLRQHGTLRVDPTRAGPDFPPYPWAYEWMRGQMARRLSSYEGYYPWWAWCRPKPDLRRWHAHCIPSGTRGVRLELAVPAEHVLVSHESLWHFVLNRWCLLLTEPEELAWDAQLMPTGLHPYDQCLPEPWFSRVIASWERIFDLEAVEATGAWSPALQATFERLDLADVIAVTEFTGRG